MVTPYKRQSRRRSTGLKARGKMMRTENVVGLLIFVAFMSAVVTLLAMWSPISFYRFDRSRIVGAVQPVVLSQEEKVSYDGALQNALKGDATQLTSWVDGLAKKGKTGLLPGMPKGFKNPRVVWIGRKAILVREVAK